MTDKSKPSTLAVSCYEKMNTTKRNPQAQKARPIARASFSVAGLSAKRFVFRPSFTAVVNCYGVVRNANQLFDGTLETAVACRSKSATAHLNAVKLVVGWHDNCGVAIARNQLGGWCFVAWLKWTFDIHQSNLALAVEYIHRAVVISTINTYD
jgi:hypothetical protein